MSGFVAQDAHTPARVPTLGLAHDAALESFETRVREIKRYRDSGHAIRREPLFRKPDMRAKVDAAVFQLDIEPRNLPP